jgi:4-amino-4-deoxy-L-arabinose transferase-like glycosyltransferase
MQGRFIAGISDYWSFFYPLFALPAGLAYGSAEAGLRLISILSGAALVLPCMLIVRRLWGMRAALFSGLLIALHPMLIAHSTSAMTESVYTLFLLLGLYFFIKYIQEGNLRDLVLMAILVGCAYLMRQEVQILAAASAVLILSGRGGPGLEKPPGVRIARVLILAAIFIVIMIPNIVLIHQKTGRWSGGSKAAVNLSSPLIWDGGLGREQYVYSLNEEGTERRIEEIGRENPLRIIWRARNGIARAYFRNMHRGFNGLPVLLISPFLLVLIPLGIFGRRWERETRGIELLLVILGLFPFLLYSIFSVQTRYMLPFLPVYLMWAALGCEVLVGWIRDNISRRPAAGMAVLIIIFASLAYMTVRRYSYTRDHLPVEYRQIGNWIRDNVDGKVRILAHSGCAISYYAGVPEATFIPWTDPEGLLKYARHHGYTHLAAEKEYFLRSRPPLAGILDPSGHPGLEPVTVFSNTPGGRIILFRILPEPAPSSG